MKNRALLRVSDTVKLADFAKQLIELGYDILCSKANSELLKTMQIENTTIENNINLNTKLDTITESMQNWIYAGILVDRSNPTEMSEIIANKIEPIDLVCVNINDYDSLNDISAISIIKAAVANVKDVTVVVDYRDYDKVTSEIREKGEVSLETRTSLGIKAMEYLVHKEILHTKMLKRQVTGELFPKYLNFTYEKVTNLKNGENQSQSAAYYKEINNIEPTIPNLKRLKGEGEEFQVITKINSAIEIMREFEKTSSVIVGDVHPCGVGTGDSAYQAYLNSFRNDISVAVGAVVVLNDTVDRKTALEIMKTSYAAVIAPIYDEDALEVLMQKDGLSIYEIKDNEKCATTRLLDFKTISGGVLIQDVNNKSITANDIICVTEQTADEMQMEDMLLAIKTAKHLKSNCCVVTKENRVVGIGSGENDIGIALQVAMNTAGNKTLDCVMAFDTAIKSPAIIEKVASEGVKVIIHSGGENDEEIINICNEKGIIMYHTNTIYNKG